MLEKLENKPDDTNLQQRFSQYYYILIFLSGTENAMLFKQWIAIPCDWNIVIYAIAFCKQGKCHKSYIWSKLCVFVSIYLILYKILFLCFNVLKLS